ncbi:MAG: RluA family pseudouridine synthase [Patescibacteria group bacterium]|jgi:23S rRNA pseudouridine1911/1915/1917 synthase
MEYKIESQANGKRLDLFLAEKLPGFSRSRLQKIIRAGKITANGKTVPPHYFLKEGDGIFFPEKIQTPREKEKTAAKNRKAAKAVIPNLKKIIIEDNDEFMVINKPAGIAVHGATDLSGSGAPADEEKPEQISLISLVVKKYPAISLVGEDPSRPGIVHRLDKDVSGVMVIAKNQKSFLNLKSQFKRREIKKTYLALVYGRVEKDRGKITFPIERSREGKMAARPANQPGKPALTDFTVMKRFINYTLLEARPKTGRTHQIRCHLAAYGNPIAGDGLYSTKETREKNRMLDLGRIFLVAVKLEFKNLAGEKLSFSAPLPDNLKKVLSIVK